MRVVTATITPQGIPTPDRAAPDVVLGEHVFGGVNMAKVPGSPLHPMAAATIFTVQSQMAMFVGDLARVDDFHLRVFRRPSGEIFGELEPMLRMAPSAEWYNTLVWYRKGFEPLGPYRTKLYSGSSVTNASAFST
jgi:hypothetical protein